jgi:hypothetical protein
LGQAKNSRPSTRAVDPTLKRFLIDLKNEYVGPMDSYTKCIHLSFVTETAFGKRNTENTVLFRI